ncbi:transketolase family protein [Capillibacterium thermochitinicola]|uniref:Transketolase family protein n=1 Tax=Capillibacterium thermochitinicola TaxID=2699427 RepID=A0A8J6LL77_9FIRM|nr:transketolase C-terminal domain-containing protein [Capillibacterium thermochitinicola]MBA2132169.1 transketolase family protein [Capillibacterium thermochitinicola]
MDRPNRRVFTETLLALAKNDRRIFALASDSRGSATLNEFAATLPDQFVEVGIAEQNLVGIAAGLAKCGKIPFVCSPACFLSMRSIEQVKTDVAYSGANVRLIGISGGVSYGALGGTHHSLQDLAVMQAIPGMTVLLPADNRETALLTQELVDYPGPVYMRLGRETAPRVYEDDYRPAIGKGTELLSGFDLTIVAAGELVRSALDAGHLLRKEGISCRVVALNTLKPLDTEILLTAAKETGAILTVEEHSIYGGLGSRVAQFLGESCPVPLSVAGFPDEPLVTGSQEELFRHYRLDAAGLVERAKKLFRRKQAPRF